MKVFFTTLFISLFVFAAKAQKIFVHVGAGAINYSGDLQPKPYTTKNAGPMVQVGVGYQFTDRLSVNYLMSTGKVSANDAFSTPRYTKRNLSFGSPVGEVAITLHADLLSTQYNNFTPYGFAGIGVFKMNPYAYDPSGTKVYLQPLHTEGQGLSQYPDRKPYKLVQLAIPFGFGFKYTITDNIQLSAEFGFRKTFTDYLDDVSSATYADTALLSAAYGAQSAAFSFRAPEISGNSYSIKNQRGNPDSKDFYYNALIRISFSFDKSIFSF